MALHLAAVAAIVLVAATLRMACLGCGPLWLDEILTAQVIRFETVAEVTTWVQGWADQTPLSYLVNWSLRGLGGSETMIRLPYIAAGTLTVLSMIALGAALGGLRLGLVAGAILTISPYAIFFSQEARAYAWLMFFSTTAILFAFRSATRSRPLDWLGVVLASTLALYSSYLALATVTAVFVVIAFILLGSLGARLKLRRRAAWRQAVAESARPAVLAVSALAVIVIAFAPWFPQLQGFLRRSDLALDRFAGAGSASLSAVVNLLGSIDLWNVLLPLTFIGVVASVAAVWTVGWRGAAVALAWLAVPLAGFAARFGENVVGIWSRYWAVVYPALILLAALGILVVADLLVAGVRAVPPIARRVGTIPSPGWNHGWNVGRWGLTAGIVGAVVYLVWPSTLSQYERIKFKGDDYPAAVAMIMDSHPQPLLLTAGTNGEWLRLGLDYYLWLRDSEATILSASMLTSRELQNRDAQAPVWLAMYPQYNLLPTDHLALEVFRFRDFELVRLSDASAPVIEEAVGLAAWASAFDPSLRAVEDLLRPLLPEASLGPNLLPDPMGSVSEASVDGEWWFDPGVAPDDSGFRLVPAGGEVNATFTTANLQVGARYVAAFKCEPDALDGVQRVYVTAHRNDGSTIAAFPDGGGYTCSTDEALANGKFAFAVPPNTASITLWLRALGEGVGAFEAVTLRIVQ